MASALADIVQDIAELSEKERVELLCKLIDDLDGPSDVSSDAAWLKQSERRLGEIEGGTAQTFLANEILEELAARRVALLRAHGR